MKILKRMAATAVALALAVSAMVIPAGAVSIEETAKKMTIGEDYTYEFSKDNDQTDYVVEVKGKGTLSVKVNVPTTYCSVYLFDSDCSNVSVLSTSVKTGYNYRNTTDYPLATFQYNSASEKIVATTNWLVDKGTYYIRVTNTRDYLEGWRYEPTAGKATITTDFTKSDEPVLSHFSMTMSKGSTIQLGGVFSNGKDTLTWKSSKASVAKVSSAGKVTAVKKGTATITATCGDTVIKIKIIVK